MRLALLIIGTSAWAAAMTGSSVNDVVALVRSAIEYNRADAQVAKALRKMDLTERLDDRVVEELESAGAGPMAVAELAQMRTASQHLKKPSAPPQFASPPEPSPQEQASIIAEARKIALDYSSSLPNFICTEVISRYMDPKGKESWKLQDTLTVDLSFFKQHEEYKLLAINNHPTYKSYESAGGQVSEGEFGSILGEVFQPASKTDFVWDHWTTLRKRPAHVFFFRVTIFDSNFTLEFRTRLGTEKVVTGARGFVYVDRDTHMVMRIVREAESVPMDFPVQQASASVDHGFTEVSGRPYLLPLRAASQMQHLSRRLRQWGRPVSGAGSLFPFLQLSAPAPGARLSHAGRSVPAGGAEEKGIAVMGGFAPQAPQDLSLFLPEWMIFTLPVLRTCLIIGRLDRRIGQRRDATRAPTQARNGWRPSGRPLVTPPHHLSDGQNLSNLWGPPHPPTQQRST